MYFSTDNSDEKTINQMNLKMKKLYEEMQRLQEQAREYNTLKQQHTEAKEDLQRSRELITLLHEKYSNLRLELSMAKADLAKKN
ncbi:Cytochrome b5 heme-binding domain-containing protein [Mucor velutinosus]|uniref:Cytochrome b5 heme-binding domain-containing protein n=1 Tax=Mucor velutinosus TaxID=708070 RepID=A0AAN7DFC9_9FUNG|nr:Cytochrome b5 heme-binding domain-containing protein [Mucor velutinosus]